MPRQTTYKELYAIAQQRNLPGRSKLRTVTALAKALGIDVVTPAKRGAIAAVDRAKKEGRKPARKDVARSVKAEVDKAVSRSKRKPKYLPGAIAEIPPEAIDVDPKRFQYKLIGEHTKSGEVGSLSGVKRYDPNLAGIVQVWTDPADGKTYVVNGHNRLALAKRLGASNVAVRFLDVKDAAEARAVGAITNIAEGRGTALDAAKFFRDTGLTKDDLDKKGIPMREKLAQDGLALSALDDGLFRKVIDGDIPVERAAIVGGSGLSHAEQRSLVDLIDKEAKKGRKLTNDVVKELTDTVKSSGQQSETQLSLFGAEEVTRSLAIEKAQLQASIKTRLGREKKLFGTVGKSKAAKDLERAGNVIDIESSQKISKDAARVLGVFDQLKNLSGPVSDLINEAASRVAAGESIKKVEAELYERIITELPKVVGGTKGKNT